MIKVIDMHAHILPGIDDGATDRAEAVQMLKVAYDQGIRKIIATPHYSRRQNVEEIQKTAAWLQEEACKLDPDFQIFLGQEILYFDSVVENLKSGHALTMAGSHYVLVEFMPGVKSTVIYQAVRKLFQNGYHPVIAHMERYQALRAEENLQELIETGCCFQMNYKSLTGSVFDRDARWCRKQVAAGRIHCLGTDMHGMVHRTPEIGGVIKWLEHHIEEELRHQLLYENAKMMIQDRQSD